MEIYKLSTVGPQKKENLCQMCEQTGELLECTGPCQGYFHTDCLGITSSPETAFKCDECTKGACISLHLRGIVVSRNKFLIIFSLTEGTSRLIGASCQLPQH